MFKHYRELKGYSITDVLNLTGLDHRELERIDTGERVPTYPTIAILVYALDIPKDVIVKYLKNPPKKKTKKKERRKKCLRNIEKN